MLAGAFFLLSLWVLVSCVCVLGRPATFLQDFRVPGLSPTSSKLIKAGQSNSPKLRMWVCASKVKYMFGRVSMKIKLVPEDSAAQ